MKNVKKPLRLYILVNNHPRMLRIMGVDRYHYYQGLLNLKHYLQTILAPIDKRLPLWQLIREYMRCGQPEGEMFLFERGEF